MRDCNKKTVCFFKLLKRYKIQFKNTIQNTIKYELYKRLINDNDFILSRQRAMIVYQSVKGIFVT